MSITNFDTLSEAVDYLTKEGFTEDFKAMENNIIALYSKKEFNPENLKIISKYRFEGLSDPDDETELFAIVANDGTKGTLVMSYGAKHNQNIELIKKIKI
ncbi:phosphoribosylpyrophosphate synthetase [Tenacibaculum piscium]|uniref:Phosphoribosylpyrophosphate synthetase n=1 Tax=Tenacibaculum piscium TaxID=1458515 RepID=A0A2H1YJZ9_9FLAO|nr:phosphoribosylpyrophosphate synthetase [Tenacibaculum piscium]MBE7629474.1 phosphoribosylpyrophosphate synthetase [Tenacibaculum piscium]MBE7671345.1 phosphoribosylpyrophosphate synthetase [Tenacibaculum piscium]MCG8183066.1 phosphoribosylpyrophosphate synthetase [Tenacibaculum piscium]MCG8204750.1 phosphoribosylpyrophosphate synthetase [Tenacibaculum piscium]SOS75730.1 Phosphoribosylpyrophosphate synthetase [Tenacibaculum piscium]